MDKPTTTSSSSIDEARIEKLIHLERANMVARLLPTSVAGSMIVILILSAVMWPAVNQAYLLACGTAMMLNQGWRLGIYLRYRKHGLTEAEVPSFSRRWLIGAGISGAIWSCCSASWSSSRRWPP